MIGDAVLREIVSADFFAAVAGAHLFLALRGILRIFLRDFSLEQARAEHRHGFKFVLLLRALVGVANDQAARFVMNLHGGIGGIHALPAFSGSAASRNLKVLGFDLKIHFLGLRP